MLALVAVPPHHALAETGGHGQQIPHRQAQGVLAGNAGGLLREGIADSLVQSDDALLQRDAHAHGGEGLGHGIGLKPGLGGEAAPVPQNLSVLPHLSGQKIEPGLLCVADEGLH